MFIRFARHFRESYHDSFSSEKRQYDDNPGMFTRRPRTHRRSRFVIITPPRHRTVDDKIIHGNDGPGDFVYAHVIWTRQMYVSTSSLFSTRSAAIRFQCARGNRLRGKPLRSPNKNRLYRFETIWSIIVRPFRDTEVYVFRRNPFAKLSVFRTFVSALGAVRKCLRPQVTFVQTKTRTTEPIILWM